MRAAPAVERAAVAVATGLSLVLGACATDHLALASKSIEEEQLEAAVAHLEEGARRGDERCDYQLALLMLSGEIADGSDPESAIRWLRSAADAGLPSAQLDLGRLYEKGVLVREDHLKAAEWYRKATRSGLPEAQTHLGLLYAVGLGVEKDPERAAKWYGKAAKGGDPRGQAALGAATFYGVGTKKDVVDGYMWTVIAARQGDVEARSALPEMARQMTDQELEKANYKIRRHFASQSVARTSPYRMRNAIYDSRDSARQRYRQGGTSGRGPVPAP